MSRFASFWLREPTNPMEVNVANIMPRSHVNGPGERFVIWVQGCPLACQGCWNPETWSFKTGSRQSIEELYSKIASTPEISGVTFSGGEPFSQAKALAQLARLVRKRGLSVFVFSGYELNELKSPTQKELLEECDIIVSGRYIEALRAKNLPWRGSSNQQVHFLTDRYSLADRPDGTEVEVFIGVNGEVNVTGFPIESVFRDDT